MNGDAVVGAAGIQDEPRNAAPHFVENFREGFGRRGKLVACVHKPIVRLEVVPDNGCFVAVKKLPPDFAHFALLLDAVEVRERLARSVRQRVGAQDRDFGIQ